MKIVVNRCYGGYSLSKAAYEEMKLPWDNYGYAFEGDRSNPTLVATVEKLGDAANGKYAQLEVVEIPDDIKWEIEEYDGREWVREVSRTW